jgi:hypothetical protein
MNRNIGVLASDRGKVNKAAGSAHAGKGVHGKTETI